MEFKQSETIKNLMKAFAGESQARNRYVFFASKAKKEGYEQISAIFKETAENEKEHAEVFYKHVVNLLGEENLPEMVEITAAYPVALSTDTSKNLAAAAAGEHEEWADLYPAFAEVAEKEGYKEVAQSFRSIATVEKHHEQRYLDLKKNVDENKVFEKDESVLWKCRNCGYIAEGKKAPKICPACKHDGGYFELLCENY